MLIFFPSLLVDFYFLFKYQKEKQNVNICQTQVNSGTPEAPHQHPLVSAELNSNMDDRERFEFPNHWNTLLIRLIWLLRDCDDKIFDIPKIC